jgi:hypothetical protein
MGNTFEALGYVERIDGLERDMCYGRTDEVCPPVAGGGVEFDGTVPRIRGKPKDGI